MNKTEFLALLRKKLAGLPKEDIDEHLAFYAESIDDRLEEGLTEAEAVAEIGSIDDISAQIMSEIPITKLVKERVRPKRRLSALEITLLALGSPIWLALLISLLAVILSLYAVIWAVIISLWAIAAALIVCAVCCPVAGILVMFRGDLAQGLALTGAGFVCAGLAVLLLPACRACGKGAWALAKKLTLGLKKLFLGKGKSDENDHIKSVIGGSLPYSRGTDNLRSGHVDTGLGLFSPRQQQIRDQRIRHKRAGAGYPHRLRH